MFHPTRRQFLSQQTFGLGGLALAWLGYIFWIIFHGPPAVTGEDGRAAIEMDVRERMQRTLDGYQAGVRVLGVEIEKADPPAQVVDAFRDVQVAEQNADAARNQAQGYAQQVLAQAEGEAEAFDKVYAQYRLAPEVTRQRLYYETMERVLSQTDKTIVETDNVTPYLPLPEIRRRSQQPVTTVTAPEGQ
mgnify:CR=1 FL=1